MQKMSTSVRIRLSAMMFLQFMMIAVFWVPLAGYLDGTLKFTMGQVGSVMSTMAIGCLLSPIVGMIADRHFASQKVLAVLNLLSGVMLAVAAYQASFTGMMVAMTIQMLCYMPTWSLTSSIAMTHSPSEKFPQIRAFGSFGWVSAGIFSVLGKYIFRVTGFDQTAVPLFCGAGVGLVAAILALSLPATPPPSKGQKASVIDVLGLKAASLCKQFDFLAFIVISTLVMIPFMVYFNLNSMFLGDEGFELVTLTMGLGQFFEIFFMLLIPLALTRIGVKWAMAIGLVMMVVRYGAFYLGAGADTTAFIYLGIVIHGVIFGFFFVGGQIYVDKKADTKIRGQAQGFLFLITFGIGALVSMWIAGPIIKAHTVTGETMSAKVALVDASLPAAREMGWAKLEDVKLYNRVLTDNELAVLGTVDPQKAENVKEEALANLGKDERFDLAAGLVPVSALVTTPTPTPAPASMPTSAPAIKTDVASFTIGGKLIVPKATDDNETLNGTIFSVGEGDKALTLKVTDNLLVLKSGDKTIEAKRITLVDKDDTKATHVAVVVEGDQMRLYTDGGVFAMRDWKPIWGVAAIASIVLLVLLVLLFHYKEAKTDATAGADA